MILHVAIPLLAVCLEKMKFKFEKTDACIRITESLCCIFEINTILLINCIPI